MPKCHADTMVLLCPLDPKSNSPMKCVLYLNASFQSLNSVLILQPVATEVSTVSLIQAFEKLFCTHISAKYMKIEIMMNLLIFNLLPIAVPLTVYWLSSSLFTPCIFEHMKCIKYSVLFFFYKKN